MSCRNVINNPSLHKKNECKQPQVQLAMVEPGSYLLTVMDVKKGQFVYSFYNLLSNVTNFHYAGTPVSLADITAFQRLYRADFWDHIKVEDLRHPLVLTMSC